MKRALKRTMAFGAGAAVFLAAMPTLATAAEKVTDVVVRNTAEDPVITRSTGTTAVAGTVSLSEGTTVQLADGSTVTLAEGTSVALADGTSVGISNTADSPVPVELVGGTDRRRWVAGTGFTFLPADEVTSVSEPFYTVPDGLTLVVTTATGAVSPGVGAMSLAADCPQDSSFVRGVFGGEDSFSFKLWHTTGEAGFGPGCELRVHATHQTGGVVDSAKMDINGYLTLAG